MFTGGTGILAVWHDIAPEGYDEFVQWHTREHMGERLAITGFLRGRRYLASDASPMCFNFYETETPDVLLSDEYLQRLNDPTPWTRRALKHFRNVNRTAGRVLFSNNLGAGGAIATIQCRVEGAVDGATLGRQSAACLTELFGQHGVVAVHLWQGDNGASTVETVESQSRGPQAPVADVVVVIESNDETYAMAAAMWLREQRVFRQLFADEGRLGIYHLQHCQGAE